MKRKNRMNRTIRSGSIFAPWFLASIPGALGVGVDETYSVPNGNFASGLSGWGQYSSGTNTFSAASGPGAGHPTTARATDLDPGQFATLWKSIALGAPGTAIPEVLASNETGRKVHLGAWVYIDDTTGASAADSLELILNAYDGTSNTPIASVLLHPTDTTLPQNKWFFVHTEPSAPCGPASTTAAWPAGVEPTPLACACSTTSVARSSTRPRPKRSREISTGSRS